MAKWIRATRVAERRERDWYGEDQVEGLTQVQHAPETNPRDWYSDNPDAPHESTHARWLGDNATSGWTTDPGGWRAHVPDHRREY
jgi:hypothetical protein